MRFFYYTLCILIAHYVFGGRLTCNGVLGEGLHVGQVIVRTVFLQPFTDILLRPENDGTDQAGLRWACVIYPIIVTGTVLKEANNRDVLNKYQDHGHV